MTARRVLVTGAAGFVGACLARRLLAEGHRVDLLVRPGSDPWRITGISAHSTLHLVDLRDADAVGAAVDTCAPEWIFHLAAHGAYSWQTDAQDIFQSTALGTLNLARACVSHGFDAFVHAGSSSEYGLKQHAPSETDLPEPNSEYAVAKLASTLLCRHLGARHGLPMTTLRLYSAYGPWEHPDRLMPTLAVHALRGELPDLVDPDTARDFVHVDDVCEAFLLAAGAPAGASGGVYNVGSGQQTTLRELVELAQRVLNVSAVPHWSSHRPRPWDTGTWVSDPSKIAGELGWRSRRSLAGGIASLSSWLIEHPELRERYRVR